MTGVDERRRLPIKQGDRIAYPVTFYDDDALYVLTGTTWRAEARHPTTGVLVATFTLTPNGAWVLTALDGGEERLRSLGVPYGGS